MGRKTFESIGKPLPKRKNLIISSQQHSIDDIISLSFDEDIYIIGGEMIYKEFLPYADIIYATEIQNEYEGDTAFPELYPNLWEEIDCQTDHEKGTTLLFKTYKSIARTFSDKELKDISPLLTEHVDFVKLHISPKIRKKIEFIMSTFDISIIYIIRRSNGI